MVCCFLQWIPSAYYCAQSPRPRSLPPSCHANISLWGSFLPSWIFAKGSNFQLPTFIPTQGAVTLLNSFPVLYHHEIIIFASPFPWTIELAKAVVSFQRTDRLFFFSFPFLVQPDSSPRPMLGSRTAHEKKGRQLGRKSKNFQMRGIESRHWFSSWTAPS